MKTEPTNQPPVRQKSTKYTIKRLRLRTPDVLQAEAVAEQQGLEYIDIAREQYQRGVTVDSALRPPGVDGKYGRYEGPRLAELLLRDIDGLISFAISQGTIPAIIQEYRSLLQSRHETLPQVMTPAPLGDTPEPLLTAVTEVDEHALGVLGMFFGTTSADEQ
jgi:hypothetical protein